MNLPEKQIPGDQPGIVQRTTNKENLIINIKKCPEDNKPGSGIALDTFSASTISAIRYVLRNREYSLIASATDSDYLLAINSRIRTSPSPRYRSLVLRDLIETAFQMPAEAALQQRPEDVAQWVSWSLRSEHKKNREDKIYVRSGAYHA